MDRPIDEKIGGWWGKGCMGLDGWKDGWTQACIDGCMNEW